MARLVGRQSAVLVQPLEAVLPHRLQQVVTGGGLAGIHDEERLVHECGDAVEDVFRLQWIADAHRFGRLEGEASRENSEAAEERLLSMLEQAIAPVHRAAERSLSR